MWLLNPALLFGTTWLVVLGLFSLKLSDLLDTLHPRTVILVGGSVAAFIIGWLFESIPHAAIRIAPRLRTFRLARLVRRKVVRRRLALAKALFLGGLSIEVVAAGGAPFLGELGIGNQIRYTDFGIPGLHGVLNSVFYALSCINFSRYLLTPRGNRRGVWSVILPFLYPLIGMSRQVAISLVVEYFFIYLAIQRPSPRLYVRVALLFVAVFLVFGYLGDLRSGRDSIILLAAPRFDYPEWLPSAFIWFYIYVCTPINNINYNIDLLPHYFPLETLGTLIPSLFRDSVLQAFGGLGEWTLANESFNVSSFFQALLSDFGVGGAVVFSLGLGVFLTRLSRKAGRSVIAFFALVVFLHGIALSFFANLMFHLVFLSQILVMALLLRAKPR